MAIERTLCIIKPLAVKNGSYGPILTRIVHDGFELLALRKLQLSPSQAGAFYAVHRQRPFFDDLVAFMCSGPVIAAALSAENAVAHWRELIGATDPAKAASDTLRKLYGTDLGRNAVHGSDSVENGLRETAFFFNGYELGQELS